MIISESFNHEVKSFKYSIYNGKLQNNTILCPYIALKFQIKQRQYYLESDVLDFHDPQQEEEKNQSTRKSFCCKNNIYYSSNSYRTQKLWVWQY